MNEMKLRCRLKYAVPLLLLVLTVFNEYSMYALHCWRWPSSSEFSKGAPDDEVRILFVADPQIIGVHDAPYMVQIPIYDSDRYLTKTFQLAFNHVQPDVVIFLGDLIDEGSVATDVEYELYVNRFRQIFGTSTSKVKHIYLPGDNDVGGEADDKRTTFKVNRFNEWFGHDELVKTKIVDFFALNYNVGDAMDANMADQLTALVATSTAPFRVILNHMNLLRRTRPKFDRLIAYTNASLVMSADTHKGKMYICKDCRDLEYLDVQWKGDKFLMKSDVIYMLNLQDSSLLHEIVVPTCSYRMGEPAVGYGAAVIERSGVMRYAVLSSSSRYFYLKLYGTVVILQLLFTVISFIKKCICRRKMTKTNYI